MNKKKLWNILLILLPLAAALLNALPNAVRLNFATEEAVHAAYYSGYSLVPVGYACLGAMVTGIGSVILTIMGIVAAVKDNGRIRGRMQGVATAMALTELTLLPMDNMTWVGGLITGLLAAEALLITWLIAFRKPEKN